MCQCMFFNCNHCTTLVGILVMGEAMHLWGQGSTETVFSAQFCCENKTALKHSLLNNKLKIKVLYRNLMFSLIGKL